MTMYERIKTLRQQKGLSQQDLARLTGYQDRSSIAKIEAGSVDLPQTKIILFAKALSVTPAQLMGLEESDPDAAVPAVQEPDRIRLLVTDHERDVILAYRAKPDMQPAVDRLLEITPALPKQKNA